MWSAVKTLVIAVIHTGCNALVTVCLGMGYRHKLHNYVVDDHMKPDMHVMGGCELGRMCSNLVILFTKDIRKCYSSGGLLNNL